MSWETQVYSALKLLVPGKHVYRDRIDDDQNPDQYIVFQQVGGDAINFLSGDRPSKKWARVQVSCWGQRRDTVNAIARTVEDALRTLPAEVLGAPFSVYEHDTRRFGTHQDFHLAYDD